MRYNLTYIDLCDRIKTHLIGHHGTYQVIEVAEGLTLNIYQPTATVYFFADKKLNTMSYKMEYNNGNVVTYSGDFSIDTWLMIQNKHQYVLTVDPLMSKAKQLDREYSYGIQS